jgi:hypothetical protein
MNKNSVECVRVLILFGVLKLFNTLNSSDWLRVHSVPDSISMVHQSSSNVCDPLLLNDFSVECELLSVTPY